MNTGPDTLGIAENMSGTTEIMFGSGKFEKGIRRPLYRRK
jgi:hypothetical protein